MPSPQDPTQREFFAGVAVLIAAVIIGWLALVMLSPLSAVQP